jgi:hypothetical protein
MPVVEVRVGQTVPPGLLSTLDPILQPLTYGHVEDQHKADKGKDLTDDDQGRSVGGEKLHPSQISAFVLKLLSEPVVDSLRNDAKLVP